MGWEGTDPIKWVAKTKDAPRAAINSFAFSVFNRVVRRTPVDTGAARGGWLPSIGQPAEGTGSPDKTGQDVINKIAVVCENAKGDEKVVLTNNLPYIRRLEYGGYRDGPKTAGGFSTQAPHGMVGVTLAKADAILEAAVRAAGEG